MPTPREYQRLAIEAALPHDGFGLFMEQRTGKTMTALWLAEKWDCRQNLVICPKKALPVWKQEIALMGLDVNQFEIVSFETFRIHRLKFQQSWDLVIVDESHRIKERKSQQTKAVWSLSRRAKKRLILSGSPQGNGMEDYYAQLKFIRPDLFPTWESFERQYLIIQDRWIAGREDPFPEIVGYKNQEYFKELLASISFRVTRDEVSKVKTRVRNRKYSIPWSSESRSLYDILDTKLYFEVQEGLVSAAHVLTKGLKLHQICGGFVKDDEKQLQVVGQDKLNKLWELIDGPLQGCSIAIVAQYKAEMDAIAQGLSVRGITFAQVRGKHQYDPKDRSQVTILHPSSGEAIQLAHHNHMIIYSMGHSYLKWAQFKDRIVLVDTPQVIYHYLLMQESMDEVIYQAVIEKKKASEAILSIYKQVRH
jgi:hypothetical protein